MHPKKPLPLRQHAAFSNISFIVLKPYYGRSPAISWTLRHSCFVTG